MKVVTMCYFEIFYTKIQATIQWVGFERKFQILEKGGHITMTQNIIRYNEYLESNRHNLADEAIRQSHEAELARNNLVVANETHRANLAKEKQAKKELKWQKKYQKKWLKNDKIKAKASMKQANAAVEQSKAAKISAGAAVVSANANAMNAQTNSRLADYKGMETKANVKYIQVQTDQGKLKLELDPKLVKAKTKDANTRRLALYNQIYQWQKEYDMKVDFRKLDESNKDLDRKLKEIELDQEREKYWVQAASNILAAAIGGSSRIVAAGKKAKVSGSKSTNKTSKPSKTKVKVKRVK